jgi:hypothetical protein
MIEKDDNIQVTLVSHAAFDLLHSLGHWQKGHVHVWTI